MRFGASWIEGKRGLVIGAGGIPLIGQQVAVSAFNEQQRIGRIEGQRAVGGFERGGVIELGGVGTALADVERDDVGAKQRMFGGRAGGQEIGEQAE